MQEHVKKESSGAGSQKRPGFVGSRAVRVEKRADFVLTEKNQYDLMHNYGNKGKLAGALAYTQEMDVDRTFPIYGSLPGTVQMKPTAEKLPGLDSADQSRHHIIPQGEMKKFFEKLTEKVKTAPVPLPRQLSAVFFRCMNLISEQYEKEWKTYLSLLSKRWGDPASGDKRRKGLETMQSVKALIDRVRGNVSSGNMAAVSNDDWEDLAEMFSWLPGNLVRGIQSSGRTRDPGDELDYEAFRIKYVHHNKTPLLTRRQINKERGEERKLLHLRETMGRYAASGDMDELPVFNKYSSILTSGMAESDREDWNARYAIRPQDILDCLAGRMEVSAALGTQIMQQTDIKILHKWYNMAQIARSVEEFKQMAELQ